MQKHAILDENEEYRYSLTRSWDDSKGHVVFIMLNPSTADATEDDATIRRCINFAKNWGHGSLEVVNLFAYRTKNPDELKIQQKPIGEENDKYIIDAANYADKIILAWGSHGTHIGRDKQVIELLGKYKLECLEKTKAGAPKHPLYVKASCVPIKY